MVGCSEQLPDYALAPSCRIDSSNTHSHTARIASQPIEPRADTRRSTITQNVAVRPPERPGTWPSALPHIARRVLPRRNDDIDRLQHGQRQRRTLQRMLCRPRYRCSGPCRPYSQAPLDNPGP
jgi:hypothetical protein